MSEQREDDERLGKENRCGCCCHQREASREPEAAEATGREAQGTSGGLVDALLGSGTGTGKAIGVGALVAAGVMLLAGNRDKLKPVVKGTLKEYYRFSDWLGSNVAQVREDLSDMAAEARHDYEQELAAHLQVLEKERQVAQRLANLARKRSEES